MGTQTQFSCVVDPGHKPPCMWWRKIWGRRKQGQRDSTSPPVVLIQNPTEGPVMPINPAFTPIPREEVKLSARDLEMIRMIVVSNAILDRPSPYVPMDPKPPTPTQKLKTP